MRSKNMNALTPISMIVYCVSVVHFQLIRVKV